MQTATILVDVQNIYYTTRQSLGGNFNYNAFWAQVSTRYHIDQAFAYAIDRGDEKQKQFQNILRAIGFTVKLKPFIQRKDGSAKGDWDVGITVDALEHGTKSDVVILLSGDGDFDILATTLRENHQTKIIVYGAEMLTALSLIKACDEFIAIDHQLLL